MPTNEEQNTVQNSGNCIKDEGAVTENNNKQKDEGKGTAQKIFSWICSHPKPAAIIAIVVVVLLMFLFSSPGDRARKECGNKDPLFCANTDAAVPDLIKDGADINAKDNLGRTPLHVVAGNNIDKDDVIKALINANADVNAKDNNGLTPLFVAISKNHDRTVEALIEAGADVNVKDNDGNTPLLIAANEKKDKKIILALLNAKADASLKDKEGRTLLHILISNESCSNEIITKLKSTGVDVNAKDNNGKTALHLLASQTTLMGFVRKDLANALLKAGADIDAKDNDGKTPRDIAKEYNNEAVRSAFPLTAAEQEALEREKAEKEKQNAKAAAEMKAEIGALFKGAETDEEAIKSAIVIRADKLAEEVFKNAIVYDAKYKGKLLKVKNGIVRTVASNKVVINPWDSLFEIECYPTRNDLLEFANVSKGQEITIMGKGGNTRVYESYGSVTIQNCRLVK